jgi:hypothetical protein
MVTNLLALGTALVLGFLHALEIDHMVAVTAFVSRRPTLSAALGFGLRWGIGHSIAVLAAGVILIATGIHWSSETGRTLEAAVGIALIAVGIWSLRTSVNLHLPHPGEHGEHDHSHGLTTVGLLHGLAGTSAVVALVPVTLMPNPWLGVAYLALFGVGVTGGMSLFAILAATAIRRAAGNSIAWVRRIAAWAGLASIAVGVWWIVRSTVLRA